jgi:hypothetical protein
VIEIESLVCFSEIARLLIRLSALVCFALQVEETHHRRQAFSKNYELTQHALRRQQLVGVASQVWGNPSASLTPVAAKKNRAVNLARDARVPLGRSSVLGLRPCDSSGGVLPLPKAQTPLSRQTSRSLSSLPSLSTASQSISSRVASTSVSASPPRSPRRGGGYSPPASPFLPPSVINARVPLYSILRRAPSVDALPHPEMGALWSPNISARLLHSLELPTNAMAEHSQRLAECYGSGNIGDAGGPESPGSVSLSARRRLTRHPPLDAEATLSRGVLPPGRSYATIVSSRSTSSLGGGRSGSQFGVSSNAVAPLA